MRDDNSAWKQQQDEEELNSSILVCVYCGKDKRDKISCCGENHFDELQNTFFYGIDQ